MAEKKEENKKNERKVAVSLVSNHESWDFEANPILEGFYIGENIATVDEVEKCIGYIFEEEDGEQWSVSNWAVIEKGLNVKFSHPDFGENVSVKELTDKKPLIRIEFTGTTTSKKYGKEIKLFNIDILG